MSAGKVHIKTGPIADNRLETADGRVCREGFDLIPEHGIESHEKGFASLDRPIRIDTGRKKARRMSQLLQQLCRNRFDAGYPPDCGCISFVPPDGVDAILRETIIYEEGV